MGCMITVMYCDVRGMCIGMMLCSCVGVRCVFGVIVCMCNWV